MRISSIGTWIVVAGVLVPASRAQTTCISLGPQGVPGHGASFNGSISADGRYVAFRSDAAHLVPADTNGYRDAFVRDTLTNAIELVTISSTGVQADDGEAIEPMSEGPFLSADARYVTFSSRGRNLVPNDINGCRDVFVRDRQAGTTERVSVDSSGVQGDGSSYSGGISADGRYVVFDSGATNLAAGDTNYKFDVFVRDRQTGTTELVSRSSAGEIGNGHSSDARVSYDGRYVAFWSEASNLVPGDSNQQPDVFVRDRQTGTTEIVSVSTAGAQGVAFSTSPSISADGRYVAFTSGAPNLTFDINSFADVFIRDRQLGTTELVSLSTSGAQGNEDSFSPAISADGRFVAFASRAANFAPPDWNGLSASDIFVRDRHTGMTTLLSQTSAGIQGNAESDHPAISADGRYVAFESYSMNLFPGDNNHAWDTFLRDRLSTQSTSLCEAGFGSVIACPCSNPPSDLGRGCDNSDATGGALLSVAGAAYVFGDSVVFTASSMNASVTSILLQGNAFAANGVSFGHGVRCVGGPLIRLYVKHAVGGTITAPDAGAGDLPVAVRSAALGDPISAGESRWYLVYYRDPMSLGGCPPSDTFNATQTQQVDWSN